MSYCKCTLNERNTGDGCRYCQPQRHINALRAEVEALKAKLPRWIPVTERLPDEYGQYQCLIAADIPIVLFFQKEDDKRDGRKAGEWYELTERYNRITHWMPLLDAPGQEPAE